MPVIIRILIFSAFLFSSCALSEKSTVTIGTFNIAWLGDGRNDRIKRTAKDYKKIAEHIQHTGADILGLQEIENEKAMEKLLKYLPDYSYVLSETGSAQKVGFIYKNDVIVSNPVEYMPLAIKKNRQRPGLIIRAQKGNFDWIMMVVHYKSTSRYDNTPELKERSREIRKQQADITAAWADSLLKDSDEKDIIIVGDFNDTPTRTKNPTLTNLQNNSSLFIHTGRLKSCKHKAWYSIDHIICSQSANERYIYNSEFIYNIYSSESAETAKNISDHCPVIMVFETESPDND